MRPDLQLALIGYGLAGRVFHAPLIQHTPGLALHSIVSSQRDTLLRSFSDVHVRDTPQQVFDDPAVDAVVIATPNAQHAPLALAALAAGKHVLVDKPFALDMAEANAVAAAACDAGRIVSVFQNRRFDADFLTLQALLAQGVLGEVAECHAHFDRYRPQVRDRWREQDGPGSGLWYDLGPHLLDQMLVLFGWPQAIDADLAVQRSGGSGVDYFHAVLHYPRHRAIVHAGSLVAAPTPRFAVHGELASWVKYGLDVQEAQLRRGVAPGAPGWGIDPRHGELLRCDADDSVQRSTVDNMPGDYRHLYAQFAAALHGDGEPTVSLAQALQVMQLLQAGMDSAQQGRRIALG
ncbi:oxidoreductase [Stenotrophomonas sp. YAU14D1_LEIMI4_1]|uniref:oxidoreductase n=1 Tax=Stenotrophomonas sp. YAU14D1_LEIMI4_1 TaxID=2072407 RepID=UPI000D541260|nr:oxidoreductase [Stenotrophomonas sp. YAU14D1_LEIMI4_1]AWH26606.1 oxidoreductase [Stenotrophomonas sp. YAU14D1_LEIMI4_1]